jgi:hypothetical protein
MYAFVGTKLHSQLMLHDCMRVRLANIRTVFRERQEIGKVKFGIVASDNITVNVRLGKTRCSSGIIPGEFLLRSQAHCQSRPVHMSSEVNTVVLHHLLLQMINRMPGRCCCSQVVSVRADLHEGGRLLHHGDLHHVVVHFECYRVRYFNKVLCMDQRGKK